MSAIETQIKSSEVRTNPHWAKTASGKFHRLSITDPEKLGLGVVSAIIVLWRGGLKPTWIYVDKTNDLARDLDTYVDDKAIMYYDSRGGVFVSWALVRPQYQDGVLKYLLQSMAPLIEHPNPPPEKTKMLPVYAPGEAP